MSNNRVLQVKEGIPARLWSGELLTSGDGGVFVAVTARGVGTAAKWREVTSQVNIFLRHTANGGLYVLSEVPGPAKAEPRIAILPSGKYHVASVSLVDPKGITRIWKPQRPQTVVVSDFKISKLGRMNVEVDAKRRMDVKFDRKTQVALQASALMRQSFVATIDGFSGKGLDKLGGNGVKQGARKNFGSATEMRATMSSFRQIQMVYKLALNGPVPQTYYTQMASALAAHDANLRTCYTEGLEVHDEIQGSVKFTFSLAPKAGVMRNLKHAGGTIRYPKLISCLFYELGAIKFPVRRNISGELMYAFKVHE
jgi:hypothetical protein